MTAPSVGPDLRELYQQTLLDHYRHPRHHGPLAGATSFAEGDNPLCGDRVRVAVRLEGATLRDIAFEGSGCAISTASASLMTEAVLGKDVHDIGRLFTRFHALVAGGSSEPGSDDAAPNLGKLEIFAGVREYPARVKCATLPWHALRAALDGGARAVSTEVMA